MKVTLAEMLVTQVTRAIVDPVERAVVTRDVVLCDLRVDYPSEAEKVRAEETKGAKNQ